MKRLPNEIYQGNNDYQGNLKKWLPLPGTLATGAPALFLQRGVFQDLPEWAWFLLGCLLRRSEVAALGFQDLPEWTWWFLLASSPIVAIISLLIIGILVLLLTLWLRSRRQPPPTEGEQIPPPTSVEQVQDTSPAAVAEVAEPTLKAEPLETPPVETIRPRMDSATMPSVTGPGVELEPQTVPISGQRPPNIGWQIAGLTDVGLKRDHNEDSLVMLEAIMPDTTPYGLYAVADGLGGHHGGEIASKLSVDAIEEEFSKNLLASAAGPFDEWLTEIALAAN